MKNIKDLSKDLSQFQKKLELNLIKAQKDTAEQIKQDTIKHLGHSSGKYADSIQKSDTKIENKTICFLKFIVSPTKHILLKISFSINFGHLQYEPF